MPGGGIANKPSVVEGWLSVALLVVPFRLLAQKQDNA